MALDWNTCESVFSHSTCESIHDFAVQWGLYTFTDWVWEHRAWLGTAAVTGMLRIIATVRRLHVSRDVKLVLLTAAVVCILVPLIGTVLNHWEGGIGSGAPASLAGSPAIQANPPSETPTQLEGHFAVEQSTPTVSPSLVEPSNGWALKRIDGVYSIYFIISGGNRGVDDFLYSKLQQHQKAEPLESDIQTQVKNLFQEIEQKVPEPEPYRTPLGPIVDQRVDVYAVHEFNASNLQGLEWNYTQVLEHARQINFPMKEIVIADLSPASQKLIATLDRLATETVRQWYVDTLQQLRAPQPTK